jgi:hypothetical protein
MAPKVQRSTKSKDRSYSKPKRTVNHSGAPRLAFLGVCERATFVKQGHPIVWCHNIIGLRHTLINYFYPAEAKGWYLVLACYEPHALDEYHIRLVDESGEQLFTVDMEFEQKNDDEKKETPRDQRSWRFFGSSGPNWILFHQSLEGMLIQRPGLIKVLFRTKDSKEELCIGTLYTALIVSPQLTEDRIAAIRADPRAAKSVRVVIGCKKCPSKYYINAGINKPKDLDGVEKVWYEDIPDSWQCSCGSTVVDLTSIRRGIPGAIGTPVPQIQESSGMSIVRMYERGALADLCGDFGALLDENPPEEEVQKFLQDHTVFLHRFSPVRIRPKAPVLTKHFTDFAILDTRSLLVLVEIEKPGLKLLKKNGDITQKLQHSFDQVRSWMHTIKRRWAATLDCMGFRDDEVAGIRYAVVAGRDHGYPSDLLMRLKGADHGPIEFFTFDDLLEDTITLSREL